MAKIRVHELAKELGIKSKDILDVVRSDTFDFWVRSASSTLEPWQHRKIEAHFGPAPDSQKATPDSQNTERPARKNIQRTKRASTHPGRNRGTENAFRILIRQTDQVVVLLQALARERRIEAFFEVSRAAKVQYFALLDQSNAMKDLEIRSASRDHIFRQIEKINTLTTKMKRWDRMFNSRGGSRSRSGGGYRPTGGHISIVSGGLPTLGKR